MERYGITIPFGGVPLAQQRGWYEECAELGYTDLWSSEVNGADGFTPLALAAAWLPDVRLGTAIIPAYTRAPAVLAQTVAALADAAPGRVAIGIGSSSDVIVGRWNGIPFEEPYKRTRDTIRFLRQALTGEKVDGSWTGFESHGFRLGLVPSQPPTLLVAALRSGMLQMAGRESDGAIINWLSADDVRTVVPHVGEGKEVVARLFVVPTPDAGVARRTGRFMISSYLTVPVYRAFHEWLGRGEALKDMWDRWAAGDRKGANEAIPDDVVDALIIHGSPDECREHIARYVANGVTTPVLQVIPAGGDLRAAIRALAPSQ